MTNSKVKPARAGYALIPCDGAAHSNPHIDNCLSCAPRWGWREVKSKIEHVGTSWYVLVEDQGPDENALRYHCSTEKEAKLFKKSLREAGGGSGEGSNFAKMWRDKRHGR
jgi:hypothetical protein